MLVAPPAKIPYPLIGNSREREPFLLGQISLKQDFPKAELEKGKEGELVAPALQTFAVSTDTW